MPKPTALTGWWFTLLDTKAKGNVALLAGLLGISTRTLNKWYHGTVPTGQNLKNLQTVAGPTLLTKESGCPKHIRLKTKVTK